ncbi:MAG TPA: 4-alpha-glucanotransferase [Anaerolineales bacterium]|nr:4-alpha-glucanotransferase [Anaerolineales bacterium]
MKTVLFNHRCGILLHVSSLPGPYGIGDLGPQATEWLQLLKTTGTRWWQVLPLGPTGYGDSPYQSYSSFAGNPNLISPDRLYEDGLIDKDHLDKKPSFPSGRVDFAEVIKWKRGLFQVAFMRLGALPELRQAFEQFRHQEHAWLDDFSLFMTIKSQEEQRPWIEWPAALRDRGPEAILEVKRQHISTQNYFAFQQFIFFRQWESLRGQMKADGIGVIGDLPIYCAQDSADVWCRRELFDLDQQGKPIRVAGVPPDMFAETGQLWGNPLYRWERHKQEGYAWWLERLGAVLRMVDVVRLDHFRGFANYYAVPAGEATAENGAWVLGPGADFLQTLKDKMGSLPLIAEDLGGEGHPPVIELRERFDLPGMKILQFAFDEDLNHRFLPHNYPGNCVAYTGTHDNDTAIGWYEHAPQSERKFCLDYLKSDGEQLAWDMLRALWASPAALTVAPLQDFLELGSEGRMNYPGRPLGNWGWRVESGALSLELTGRIAELNRGSERSGGQESV